MYLRSNVRLKLQKLTYQLSDYPSYTVWSELLKQSYSLRSTVWTFLVGPEPRERPGDDSHGSRHDGALIMERLVLSVLWICFGNIGVHFNSQFPFWRIPWCRRGRPGRRRRRRSGRTTSCDLFEGINIHLLEGCFVLLSHFRDTRSDIFVIPKDDKYLIVNFVKHYKCDNRYLVCRILETIVYIFLNVRQPGNLVMCAWRGLAMPRINFRVCAGSETPQISLQGWLNPKTNEKYSVAGKIRLCVHVQSSPCCCRHLMLKLLQTCPLKRTTDGD